MIDEKKIIDDIKEWSKEKEIKWTSESVISLLESAPKIGEWIPCSERLPTMEECQKNDCRFILDDGNRRYQGLFDYIEKRFIWFNCEGTHKDKCIIAWQPLPAPYEVKSDE